MNRIGRATLVIGVIIAVGVIYLLLSGAPSAISLTSQAGAGYRVNGLVAANQVLVSAKIDGRIDRLMVEEGTVVKRGDVIAVIGLEEAKPERKDRQSNIDQLAVKLQRGQENVMLETDKYASEVSRSQKQLQAAESDVHEAALQLEQLKRDQKRIEELWGGGIVAKQDAERARNAVDVGEAKVKALEERVSVAKADLDLVRSGERQIALASHDVDQTKSELLQANARMTQLLTQFGYSKIVSPLAGVVSTRVSEEGEVVKAGTPIVSIVDLDDIWVKASFEERLVSQVVLGQQLPVHLASGEELQGKVVQIAPESEFATQRDVNRTLRDVRTFALKVKLPNPGHRIHPGITAYVFLRQPTGGAQQTQTPPGTSPLSR